MNMSAVGPLRVNIGTRYPPSRALALTLADMMSHGQHGRRADDTCSWPYVPKSLWISVATGYRPSVPGGTVESSFIIHFVVEYGLSIRLLEILEARKTASNCDIIVSLV